ncbi:MAG TPA: DAK2 domain-containing protein [Clostridia bacterium]|nr:DAK2 domain-containing protein [Clostridia bacterium]
MQYKHLEVGQLRRAFQEATTILEENKSFVDSLNVFPVPDGDTGTNMHLTMTAAVREMDKTVTEEAPVLLKALANGALMGARGNSGVILSQLLRGFSQIGARSLDALTLAEALQKAVEIAYRSVIKPVEGTILTVARSVAKGALEKTKASDDCLQVLEAALEAGEKALGKTPQMLPVLAEAGVVDAGGQGLIFILQGMIKSFYPDFQEVRPREVVNAMLDVIPAGGEVFASSPLEFKYCTELIIKGQEMPGEALKQQLMDLGDSLLVVGEKDLLKVHIHTNHPGRVLELCANLGTMHDIKIDNMEDQHREETVIAQGPMVRNSKSMGVVAVTTGKGLEDILKSLGVDVIVPGGQTMNPSTQDLLVGIKQSGAERVLILPNNKNIILAAEQAQKLASEQGLQVAVIPSKNFAQALAAMLVYNPEKGLEDNQQKMTEALTTIKSGEMTYAVRDSQLNGLSISKGEILGLAEGQIVTKGSSDGEVALELLGNLGAAQGELLSIFFGEDVSAENAASLMKMIEERFPSLEMEVHEGGQPLYYYIFALE